MARVLISLLASLAVGCGARTALDEGRDAATAPDAGPVMAEACNGADDDADGAIDEGITPQRCGVGACAVEAPGCAAGRVPACVPGPAATETCDGVDDDCDGLVDEGLGFGPVGEPVVLREADELGSDGCSTCRLAFSPDLVSTEAGMLATWRVDLGSSNLYARLTDDDGHPADAIQRLPLDASTQGPRSMPHPVGAALVYCGRVRDGSATFSALLSPTGQVLVETEHEPRGRSCGAWTPDLTWTGRRTLVAWTDNSSGPVPGHEVLLDVTVEGGVSVDWHTLEPDAQDAPRMAVGHGRALVAVPLFLLETRRSLLAVHTLDLDGNSIDAAHIEMPGAMEDVFDTPHAFDTPEGFVVIAASGVREGGHFITRFGPDGSPMDPPRRTAEGAQYINGFDDVIARGDGFVLASSMRWGESDSGYGIRTLTADGEVEAEWRPDDAMARAAFAVHRGRLFVVYVAGVERERNEVRLRELGCVP